MTTLLPSASRRSRYLFDWNAASCLAAPEQALDAITSQLATFTRASTKTALDANGAVRIVPHSLPAFQWTLDPVSGLMVPGVLMEDARTNVVLWSRDLTNAAWTKSNVTATQNQIGADGIAASATSLTATAGNGTALQAITLGSSARAQSAYVKRITGSGVIQMTTDNGATWTAVAVTSAWSRVSIPAQTLANPTVGFRIVTNGDAIAVDFVQNENGPFPTSPILTTTVAVARTADALSFAFGQTSAILALTGLTLYDRLVATDNSIINCGLILGSPGVGDLNCIASSLVPGAIQGAMSNASVQTTSSVSHTVAPGERIERVTTVTPSGVVTVTVSINGAAAVSGTPGAANAWPIAFAQPTLYVGDQVTGTRAGDFVVQSIKIAAGVQAFTTIADLTPSSDEYVVTDDGAFLVTS
jgi:hypothetical protein